MKRYAKQEKRLWLNKMEIDLIFFLFTTLFKTQTLLGTTASMMKCEC